MLKTKIFYDFFSRLSKKEKRLFYCALFFLSIALFDLAIVFPISSKMKSLDKEIGEKSSRIKKYLRILAQKDKIAAEREKYKFFLTSIDSENKEIIFLLKEIEALADKNSVYLTDMKPIDYEGDGIKKKYLVSLNCESQLEQLVMFMYSIESSAGLLTIDKYEISPKSKDSSIIKCSMSISKIIRVQIKP